MNYYLVSARVEFADGYIYDTMKHLPFDIKPYLDELISLERTTCNNALVKVELSLWDKDNNIIKIMDATSTYNGGTID